LRHHQLILGRNRLKELCIGQEDVDPLALQDGEFGTQVARGTLRAEPWTRFAEAHPNPRCERTSGSGSMASVRRAWEQRYGLLRPSRSACGFRLYSDEDTARILRTKQLIASGLSAGEAARQAVTGETATQGATPVLERLAAELGDALDRFERTARTERSTG
jgi:hypothetical protein